ncbi:MAG: hypothetical protein MUD08_17185 [Cytophagales bacterium]|nr:hypothetical protein [Cytophagales bacterium]
MVNNRFYMARQWVLLIHPFPTLLLAVGLFLVVKEKSYGFAVSGLLFTALEKLLEFVGQTIQLFTVNLHWRMAYLSATDSSERANLALYIKGFTAVWNDCFFVLWVAYLLAAVFFGLGLRKVEGTRWTNVALLISAFFTFVMIMSDYGRQAWLQPLLPVFYPLVMVVSRLLIGVFLWRKSMP